MSTSNQPRLFDEADLPPREPLAWEQAAAADQLLAEVVFDRPLETSFQYLVPDSLREVIGAGRRIRAPFGKGDRLTVGFCVGVTQGAPPERRLKMLDAVLDREPLIDSQMLELTRWIARRYLCGWGQVLHSVVPAGVKNRAGTRMVTFLRLRGDALDTETDLKLPAKQQAVLDVLRGADGLLRIEELAERAQCGTGPITALRGKGLIEAVRERVSLFGEMSAPVEPHTELTLNGDQRQALDAILETLRSQSYRTLLLHGVTGSGKTEVYIRAIEEVVSYGRQAIVLVPEISLTPQTIRRFRSRFASVAVLHSHLSDSERHWQWQRIARGGVQVVVGARSAVFAPTPSLGIIVIDEEHETSFKQETTPRYHAREVAARRAEMEGVPLVLGSATPTLESWLRVQRGPDRLLSLPKRVAGLPLPPVSVVDTRNDPHVRRGNAIGRTLAAGMQTALAEGGQVILFLNVRGYSPVLWCRACGEGIRCPDCDITLTWHRDRNTALCHVCEHATPTPSHCPRCGHAGVRHLGVGTQRLEQEVRARFPEAACLRMDSDTMRRPGSHDEALEAFRRGDVQILLGTQMIAKGLDFPNVTLVGVIDADTLLHQPDLRAAERTFQLIAQVAGRTGRSLRGGRVLVQSSCPEEPAILRAAAHDYLGFVKDELRHRRECGATPYVTMARLIARGPVASDVAEFARAAAERLRSATQESQERAKVLGPAPCPVTRLKGQHRYHLQLTAERPEAVEALVRRVLPDLPNIRDVDYVIDVDPVNLR